MTSRAETDAAIEQARELFADLGGLSVRRMFGGAGLYHGPIFFSVIFEGEIYLRADEDFARELAAEGSIQFEWVNEKTGKQMRLKYWRLPDAALDSPETATALAKRACAIQTAAGRKPKRKK